MASTRPKLYVPFYSLPLRTLYHELTSMTAVNQGLTNLGALVGVTLALLITGRLNDWGIVWMSQHNRSSSYLACSSAYLDT